MSNVVQDLVANLHASFAALWEGILAVLPGIVEGVFILVVGYIVAVILGKIIGKVVEVIRLDELLAHAGVRAFFQKAGIKLNIDGIIAAAVKWFVIVVAFISAANAFGLPQVVEFLKNVLNYIPNVIIAVIIAIAGVLIANFAADLAHGTTKATGTGSPTMVATIIRYAVIIFTVVVVLDQLQVGAAFLDSFFNNLGLALAGAFGLAFGLGGKDVAASLLEKAKKDLGM